MRIFLYRTCGAYWIFTVYSKWIWCFPLFPFCFKEEPKIFFIKPLILQSVHLLDCQDDYIFGACATDILNLSLLVALKEMMMAPLLIPSGGKTTQKEYFQWAAASGYQSTTKLQRNRVLPVGLLLSCLSGVSWTLMSSFNSKPGSHCHKISSFFFFFSPPHARCSIPVKHRASSVCLLLMPSVRSGLHREFDH